MKRYKILAILLAIVTAFFAFTACDDEPKVEEPDPLLISIRIKTAPTKHLYLKYDELDVSGGRLELVYDKGPTKEVDLSSEEVELEYEPFLSPGLKTIIVKYSGFETSFYVTVSDLEIYPELVQIQLSQLPTRLEYLTRDTIDLTGGKLRLIYDKGPEGEIDLKTAAGISIEYDFSTVGTKKVIINYKGLTTEYEVLVTEPVEPEGYGIGKKKAPELIGYTLDGKEVKLSDFWGRKPVFISLWQTWCGPCLYEMPHFQSLYEEMGDEFEIIAISNESKSTINNYIKNKKFTYYILHDRTGNVFKTWLAGHYPTNYMIDKWGYLYTTTNTSDDKLGSYEVGTMSSVAAMRTIVQGAINRANNYQG